MSAEDIERLNLSTDVVAEVLRGNSSELMEMVLKYVLLISGKQDTNQLQVPSIINGLLDVMSKYNNATGKLAIDSIINITGSDAGVKSVLESAPAGMKKLVEITLDKESVLAEQTSKALANITRVSNGASAVAKELMEDPGLDEFIDAVCDKSYNKKQQSLKYLAQVLGNLAQDSNFQTYLLDPLNGQLQRVLPIVHDGDSVIERFGIASCLYNCLFDSGNHKTLLSPPYEILPILVYPLAGGEEFNESEYEKMPLDLQYLPPDKVREPDTTVRNLLLRSLLLLCTTKSSRSYIRDSNVYFILREYHKWETDRTNLFALENVVDIIIRTEEEIGVDDIRSLDVPDDLKEKFEKWNLDYLSGDC